MKNKHIRRIWVQKRIIIFLLFVLLYPKIASSQLNLTLTTDLRSFETPLVPGSGNLAYMYNPTGSAWIFNGQSGLTKNGTGFTDGNPNAPLGNQVLFLQNQGNVQTVYNFPFNGYYRFRFKAAWRENCCETIKTKYIRVSVDGVEAGEVELRSKNYEEYVTLPLYLTAGNHTIKLEGDNPTIWGDYTGFVDDFGIQIIDELPSGSDVTVPHGSTYVIDTTNYNFTTLKVQGTLVAPQNHDVNINAQYILVEGTGKFQIGMERSPYLEEAIITLNGTDLDQQHMHMGTKFLGAMDSGVIELHGKEKVSWTKLRETVNAANSVIKVVDPIDWEVGDEIVIAPSRAPSSGTDETFAFEYDKRSITSISNGNKDLTLNSGLTYKHTGQTVSYSGNGQNWTVDERAEVGLLTRNIKIQGDAVSSSTKLGAHVMIMGNAEAYFNGVELYRVGQSKKIARYPFHWHMRNDADGQYFKNSSVHQSYNRALTIHRTNDVLVENNVFFDHIGHGIFLEEGNEERNQIIGNLVIGTKRPLPTEALSTHVVDGETIDEWQNRGPASYWITHPNNTVKDNVAAGTVGTGFWYIFPRWDLGGLSKEPQKAPFGIFERNVAHNTNNGFDIFDELGIWDWSSGSGIFYPHSVHRNIGYLSLADYEILNCTWYSNRVGVYTGSGQNRYTPDEYAREIYVPNNHLIFKNNVFADNEKAVMLASDNQIQNSIFVEDTGLENAPASGQSMVFMYDGAVSISNSHIVGFNSSSNSMMSLAGAAFTYGNFRFNDVTTASSVVFNIPGGALNADGRRNVTIYDEDGSLTGYSGSTLVMNNDFMLLGGESTPSGWTNFLRSSRRYVNTRLRVHLNEQQFYGWVPKVDVIRSKNGTTTETIPSDPIGRTPTLPFIMNDIDLLYTYQWVYGAGETISTIMPDAYRMLQFKLAKVVQANDFVIVRFKDMGLLAGVHVDTNSEPKVRNGVPNQTVSIKTSLSALKSSQSSAYYNDGNDIYLKAVANGDFAQFFNIKWGLTEIPEGPNNGETLGELEKDEPLADIEQIIYPNPASNKLFIKGLEEGEEVQIVDVSGRLIQITIYNEYLDVSQLKSGLYIVKTKDGSYRFIKE